VFPKLFEPGFIRGLRIKNRLVMAPISTNFADAGGNVTELLIHHYKTIASGGVGLLIVENVCIQYPQGRHGVAQPRIDSDEFISGLHYLTHAIHRAGALVAVELMHPGAVADLKLTEEPPLVAPSAVPVKHSGVVSKKLTKNEIEKMANLFGEAALRAKEGGFDMVEVHAGHGLLLNQFLSPLTNKRKDEYGGNLEGRVRFPAMVIRKVKEHVGWEFPVSVRLGVKEFEKGGITLEEGKTVAKKLAQAGADAIHTTLGGADQEKRLEPMQYPQGWRVFLAREVKKAVDIPVLTVGVIREPWFAEKILEEGQADFIALGRALIADPEWPKKARKGEERAIRKCISCNECVRARHFEDQPIRCSVNPTIGEDRKFACIGKAEKRKRIMVVGAGPAGMEAARVATLRGHEVYLHDKRNVLGGTLNLAAVIPGKEKLQWIADYYEYVLPKLGVRIKLGGYVDEGKVKELNPDVVVISTGAEPVVPDIPGVDNPNVVSAYDILEGKMKIENEEVVVVGGGLVGLETAEFLASKGNKVTVVKRYETISKSIEPIYASHLLSDLEKQQVKIIFKVHVTEILRNKVILTDIEGKRRYLIFDKVVLARGLKPSNELAKKLKGKFPLFVIGDCKKPRRIFNAVYEGFTTMKNV